VGALLNAAEDAQDYETFRERLNEIVADGPSPEAMTKITRATVFSRLLGAFRAQRRA
jgi:hypothetical protein